VRGGPEEVLGEKITSAEKKICRVFGRGIGLNLEHPGRAEMLEFKVVRACSWRRFSAA
jgi:hypothetical protein